MTNIIKRKKLSDLVWCYRIVAPLIARKRKAGQFVILRPDSTAERIPLTIANADPVEGWIEIIFQVVGSTTMKLASLLEGDAVLDIAGPLGKPTHIENFGSCLCIGGGVGVAPLFPIIGALKESGNKITTIVGARSKNLLLLINEIKTLSESLLVATDDGSEGYHGFVSDVFSDIKRQGQKFDIAFVIGPALMMKSVSNLTLSAGIKTIVSLNPIMIDGTGMCGGCRVTINNEIRFACVDGPEFDASALDWDEMTQRLTAYKTFETKDKQEYVCKIGEI